MVLSDRPDWTPAELRVIRLIAEGLTNQQIANRLGCSAWTVKTHILNAGKRMGVSGRVALLREARERGCLGEGLDAPTRARISKLEARSAAATETAEIVERLTLSAAEARDHLSYLLVKGLRPSAQLVNWVDTTLKDLKRVNALLNPGEEN